MSHILNGPAEEHPSNYALISYLQAELSDEQQAKINQHVDSCPDCKKRLESITEQKVAFNSQTDLAGFIDQLEISKSKPKTIQMNLKKVPALAGMAALAAILIVVMVLRTTEQAPRISIKGVDVVWVVKRGEKQLAADSSFAFKLGDRIAFQITTSSPLFATVVAVDRQAEVSILAPQKDQAAIKVPSNQKFVLPFSLLLQPPFEPVRLYLILSKNMLSKEHLSIAVKDELDILDDAHVEYRLIEINN
jgi:anti-sigma factor RsiW